MIDPKPIKKTADQLKGISRQFKSGFRITRDVNVILFHGMTDIRNTIIRKMRDTKTDRSRAYKVTKSGKMHYASRPFYPPAISTGELRDSYMFDIDMMSATIGSKKVYSRYLEKGTKKMQPRPVLHRSVKRHDRHIRRQLADVVGINIMEAYSRTGVIEI